MTVAGDSASSPTTTTARTADAPGAVHGRPSQLASLQMGRAFAAQYVVLFHVPAVIKDKLGSLPGATGYLQNRFVLAGSSGVEFFFILSGFIIAYVHGRDLGKPDRLGHYARNRFVRIYPVFWIVFALFVAGQLALGALDPLLRRPVDFLWALLLLPFPNGSPMTVAWTLSHELLFYLLFGLAILRVRLGVWMFAIWFLASAVAVVAEVWTGVELAFPGSFFLSALNMLFLMGIAAAVWYQRLTLVQAGLALTLGIALFAVTILFHRDWPNPIATLCFGLGSMGIVAGLARLEHLGLFAPPRWLVFMGNASYATYLLHSSVMAFVAILLLKLHLAQSLPLWAIAVLLFALGTFAGLLFHVVVERPMLAVLRRRRPVAARA